MRLLKHMIRLMVLLLGTTFIVLPPSRVSSRVQSRSQSQTAENFSQTPANFKIAFIGDQGGGQNAVAVLNLINLEGANAVLHSGDLDYADNPAAWEDQINS